MGSNTKTEAKPKRVTLTPAERIAKAEAELAAAKEKAYSKLVKEHASLLEQAAKNDAKIAELQAKNEGIAARAKEIEEQVPADLLPSKDTPLPLES